MDTNLEEVYVSVDVETAGPNPGEYSLLSIGACLVADTERTFYVELQPTNDRALPSALAVCKFSLEQLKDYGLPPVDAMAHFATWVEGHVSGEQRPVFVGFNAAFDWMFVHDYFHRFLGRNPFGHSALDIKSFYMGLSGVRWSNTSMHDIADRYLGGQRLSHHALSDAQHQAEIFRAMQAEAGTAAR
jgi:ribonuclease T